MKRLLGMIVIICGVMGCRQGPDTSHLTMKEIPGWEARIQVPPETIIQTENNHSVTLRLNPGGREIRQFSLSRFPQNSAYDPEKLNLSRTLPNGLSIQFHTWIVEGGSGGREYIMEGELTGSDVPIFVNSVWQEEVLLFDGSKNRRQDFALLYLGTLNFD